MLKDVNAAIAYRHEGMQITVVALWCKVVVWIFLALWSKGGYGLLIPEVSRSHITTHHSRYGFSGRVIRSSQRPPPDNTQHLQETDIHTPRGIRTQILSWRAAANQPLRRSGHLHRYFEICIEETNKTKNHLMSGIPWIHYIFHHNLKLDLFTEIKFKS